MKDETKTVEKKMRENQKGRDSTVGRKKKREKEEKKREKEEKKKEKDYDKKKEKRKRKKRRKRRRKRKKESEKENRLMSPDVGGQEETVRQEGSPSYGDRLEQPT